MPRYKLEDKIGRGSWSVVYKATDSMNGDIVAVKQFTGEAGIPKRELGIGRRITHRNVCRVFDYFVDDTGANCISMEYVDGGNLRTLIEQSPNGMPVEKCLSIVRQILDGLEAAHHLNIVHRDLKPENILLTSGGAVKVSDFGQARIAGTPQSLESLHGVGTPAYMAPEQSMGGECDARADIFSLGIILHELLTGKRPEMLTAVSFPPEVPAHVQAAIRKCLEIDPAQRFGSISQVRSALIAHASRRASRLTAAFALLFGLLAGGLLFKALLWDYPGNQNQLIKPNNPIMPAAIKPEPPLFPAGPKSIQRVAVIDFENLTGDKTLDPYTVGISETLSTELAQIRGLTVIDRNRVREASREPTPSDAGRLMGADTLITGSFQKLGDDVRLSARVFDTETGAVVRQPSHVDGAFKDLFKLQAELAKQLSMALQGSPAKVSDTGVRSDAFRTFSDGLYFLRSDLAADALKQLDQTLQIDPNYPGAEHYRGLVLAKLNRLDEAIEAFKRALPRSEPERLVLWSWDAPASGAPHGWIRAMDSTRVHIQHDRFEDRKVVDVQKQIVYGERSGKVTVLHFFDAEHHEDRRLEVSDPNILLNVRALGNDAFVVLPSADRRLYVFTSSGSLLWQVDLAQYGADAIRYALIGNALYIYSPSLMQFDLFDARNGSRLWRREGLQMEVLEEPLTGHTNAHGDILIAKSPGAYRAIRKSDGRDAWTVNVQSQKNSELINDRILVVFEPERRIFSVDLETGKTIGEIKIEQFVDAIRMPATKWLVGAVLRGNTVYFLSNDLQMCAADVLNGRVLWKTPLPRRFQEMRVQGNLVYVGMETGEIMVMNAASGAITATTKLTDQPVQIDYAGDDGVIARSNNTLFSLSVEGAKKWEHSPVIPLGEVTWFKGAILIYTSLVQISALDAGTGKVLWQHTGATMPSIHSAASRPFVLDESGVKEYATGPQPEGVTEKATLIELARAYLAKNDLKSARAFVDKTLEQDPGYPDAVLIRARLLKAQGRGAQAGKDLARYASLVGLDSKEGQRTIAELKQDDGLLWESATGWNVAGEPVIVGDRLVSVGRADPTTHESSIVGLNLQTGAIVWRYNTERFAASAVGANGTLWYVTGSQVDTASVSLYRVDARTGERKQVTNWRWQGRVDQTWIATAGGRVFVAETSSEVSTGTVQVEMECRDASSGARLWTKSQSLKVSARELGNPLSVFAVDGDSFTYRIGKETWTLRTADGGLLPPVKVAASKPSSAPMSLWPPSSFHIQDGRMYAFTAEGRAYAMKQ
jgi:serine/threonine protein kinase/outer membrane protein assembly factor BamB